MSDSLSRIFELLFTLSEVSTGDDQKNSRQQSTPRTNLETDNAQILAPETKRVQDSTSNNEQAVEYVEQSEGYNNPVSSQKDQDQSLKDNIVRRGSLFVMADEGIQVTGNVGIGKIKRINFQF